MNTNSRLTEEQIAEGWIEIKDKDTLESLWSPHHQLLDDCGVTWDAFNDKVGGYWLVNGLGTHTAYNLINTFIAYRPLPRYEEYQALQAKIEELQEHNETAATVNESLLNRLAAANNGKTLRDEIAIAVLSALIQSLVVGGNNHEHYKKHLPDTAYEYADAMLKARGDE